MIGEFKNLLDFFQDWLQSIGIQEGYIQIIISLLSSLFLLLILFGFLKIAFNWIILLWKKRLLNRDLYPYFTAAEIDRATRYYIPSKFQNVAPSQDQEPGRRNTASARNKLIPLFIKKFIHNVEHADKYNLILADSGMGKTTFMINLYLSYRKKQIFYKRKFDIKLFPLGHPSTFEDILKIPNEKKKDTILLLDAFDEDVLAVADYKKRMEEIIEKVWRFREVVITCRTQFFPSSDDEPQETGQQKFGVDGGEYIFYKLYLSVFDDNDVRKYLSKRYNVLNPLNWRTLKKASSLSENS